MRAAAVTHHCVPSYQTRLSGSLGETPCQP